jgi:hypothetical protein
MSWYFWNEDAKVGRQMLKLLDNYSICEVVYIFLNSSIGDTTKELFKNIYTTSHIL